MPLLEEIPQVSKLPPVVPPLASWKQRVAVWAVAVAIAVAITLLLIGWLSLLA